jgi:hypothetical protein
MKDMFRPRNEPACLIYDALIEEATKRKDKDIEEWIYDERMVVWNTAKEYAKKHSLYEPTLEEIVRAENMSVGFVDYAAKFAYKVTELVTRGRLSYE